MKHTNTGRTARLSYNPVDGALTIHIEGVEPEVFTDINEEDADELAKAATGRDTFPKQKPARRK